MTTLYAVFKMGVYRHECAGVFSTLKLADAAANQCITHESDDYHQYQVVPFELDAVTMQTLLVRHTSEVPNSHFWCTGGALQETPAVSTWSRTGDKVINAFKGFKYHF